MRSIKWHDWGWQYGVPFVVLAGGFVMTMLIANLAFGAEDPDFLYFLVIAPVLALLIGLIMKPDHVWIVPVLIVIAALITAGITNGVGHALSISLSLFGLVGVPLTLLIWLGKALRSRLGDTHSRNSQVPTA